MFRTAKSVQRRPSEKRERKRERKRKRKGYTGVRRYEGGGRDGREDEESERKVRSGIEGGED